MPANTQTLLAEPYHSAYERLRVAVKSWLVQCDGISPGSPDYAEQVRGVWEKNGVSEEFWRLEQMVIPDQTPRAESIGK